MQPTTELQTTLSLHNLSINVRQGGITVPALRMWLVGWIILCSDLAALSCALLIPILLWSWSHTALNVMAYAGLFPWLALFIAAYLIAGLYPSIGIHAVEELRRLTVTTSTVFPLLAVALFLSKVGDGYSRGIFLSCWALALVAVPLFRSVTRSVFARRSWWGYPVVVLSDGPAGRSVVKALRRSPGFGLKPLAVFDDQGSAMDGTGQEDRGGGLGVAPAMARACGVRHALVAVPDLSGDRLHTVLDRHAREFPHVLVVPDLSEVSSLWTSTKDLGGFLGLEIRQQLLLPVPRALKMVLDYTLTVVGGMVALPLILALAVAMRLTSKGPVFYSQWRIGMNGERFRAWKFRTMVENADAVLQRHLDANPALRKEWLETQKLKNDPRVTPIGRILRRTSLDELPQLWNVLRGEMSLVGPRPIVDAECARYGDNFGLLIRVRPGVTGLWQVSGRSDTSYAERVQLDSYYIRNWSPWMDLYILARTVGIVLLNKGAY